MSDNPAMFQPIIQHPSTPILKQIMPIPIDAPEPPPLLGSNRWWYENASGQRLFAVDRHEPQKAGERKSFLPLILRANSKGEQFWVRKHPEAPRPLYYCRDRFALRTAATPFVVVEGEKTADAAAELFPDYVVVTSSGGADAAAATDWSALAGQDVIVWGDNDEPGQRYAAEVAKQAKAAKANSVRVVQTPEGWPKGWDLADDLPEGISEQTLRRMLDEAAHAAVWPVHSTVAPTDLDDANLTPRDALLYICDEVTAWRSTDGVAFATIKVDGHVEHHAVLSGNFQNWLLRELARRYAKRGRPASATDHALREARSSVMARALMGGQTHSAALRVIEHCGSVFIDLGTPDWSVIKVSCDGIAILPQAPVPIVRGKRAGPFLAPAQPGSLRPLRRLLRQLDNHNFILLVAWCLGALLPRGPYPILLMGGEQGSGKSMLARLVQRITDPVHGDVLQPPGSDRDLIAAASANRVLCFDNLSSISADLADSLCRLATGSEIGGRALFTDHDSASFSACRPLVLNGIPDLASRGDLADRAIVLRLPPLRRRMTERDWEAEVEAILPATFAALLNALSCGLRKLDETPIPSDIRMADFARFMVAAEESLPWRPGRFVAAYRRSRLDVHSALAAGDAVATAIRLFMSGSRYEWTGSMANLLSALSASGRSARQLPGNARWLSADLRRVAPTLRALGIDFDERRVASGTNVTLRRIATLATSATLQAPPAGSESVASVARALST